MPLANKPPVESVGKLITRPAAARPALVEHCLELLAPLGRTRAGRMFGGWALYADDLCIALMLHEQLYLKTDAAGRAVFAAAGSMPFVYGGAGKVVTTSYWTAPGDAMDSPMAMLPWARLAQRAALAARAAHATHAARPRKPGAAGRAQPLKAVQSQTAAPRDRRAASVAATAAPTMPSTTQARAGKKPRA